MVYELAKWLNLASEDPETDLVLLAAGLAKFSEWLTLFGIYFVSEELLDEEIEQLINERIAARKAKDFARSDQIRDELKEQGIILEDTPQGTRWRREA